MQSNQVDSERLRTRIRTYKITSNPTNTTANTTSKPHASLDTIQLFSILKTRNSYLINWSPY